MKKHGNTYVYQIKQLKKIIERLQNFVFDSETHQQRLLDENALLKEELRQLGYEFEQAHENTFVLVRPKPKD